MLKNLLLLVCPGLCYVLLSLIMGDNHPFGLETMYSSFPIVTSTFSLTDGRGDLLPIERYYHYSSADLSHYYASVCLSKKTAGNDESRNDSLSRAIGREMFEELARNRFASLPRGNIQLHQIDFYLQGDSIHNRDKILYDTAESR